MVTVKFSAELWKCVTRNNICWQTVPLLLYFGENGVWAYPGTAQGFKVQCHVVLLVSSYSTLIYGPTVPGCWACCIPTTPTVLRGNY